MQKLALFWQKLNNKKVKCLLCPRFCEIAENNLGFCKMRQNISGELFSLNYGKCVAVAIDPIEKKPINRFKSGTKVFSIGSLSCNFDCKHCQNWHISKKDFSNFEQKVYFFSPLNLADTAIKNNCQGIAFTYNEPTIWFEFCLDSAIIAKEHNLYTVFVSNGYINPEPFEMLAPYLSAYCLDIKGFSNDFYQKICGIDNFEAILATAIIAKKHNIHIEIVTNLIPSFNTDEKQLKELATWIKNNLGADTPWTISRFFPNHKFLDISPTSLDELNKAKEIGLKAGLKYIYLGNI